MNLKEIISKNLKALRNKSELSQEEYAAKFSMAQRAYGRVENGENWPHLETLEKIALYNGLEVWQLLISNLDISNPPMLAKDSAKQKEFYDRIKEAAKELSKFQ
jgi:transcriptional regulator with XRE-family HTH domain